MAAATVNPFLDTELAGRFAAGAIALLQTASTAEGCLDLVRTAIYYADHCLARLAAEEPLPQPLACEPGCDACCYNQIELTAPEALFLGSFLASRFPPEQRQALRERADQALARRAGLSKRAIAAQRAEHPCPLLQAHRCLAYEARPLLCRAMHSLDAAACYRELADPLHPIVPFYNHIQIIYVSLSHGLNQVCKTFHLQTGPLDLAQVLLTLCDQPDLARRWLMGDKVFG